MKRKYLKHVNSKIIEYFETSGAKIHESYTFNYVDEKNKGLVVRLLNKIKGTKEKSKKILSIES